MSTAELTAALGEHPLFSALGEAARRDIVRRSSEIHLDPGGVLYKSGELATQVYVVLSGALQIEYPVAGKERGPVAAVLAAPAFLGECQVLGSVPWSGTGVAVGVLLALGIDKREFVALTAEFPVLTRRLYLELARRFLLAIETWRFQPTSSPELSVARYLLAMRQVSGAAALALRQVDVGNATGLRRETVNRILGKWSKAGAIAVDPATITLRRAEVLEELVAATPAAPLVQVMPSLDDDELA